MNNTTTKYERPSVAADHIALDMINTIAYTNGHIIDYWKHPQDVIDWLKEAADITPPLDRSFDDQELFDCAVELRNLIRHLVELKKNNAKINYDKLNHFLQAASSHLLIVKTENKDQLEKKHRNFTALGFLSPITELAANLLVNVDFELVKKCEDDCCVLWFYDKSKAHKRRWCSMSLCGNRHKVSQYRKKQKNL